MKTDFLMLFYHKLSSFFHSFKLVVVLCVFHPRHRTSCHSFIAADVLFTIHILFLCAHSFSVCIYYIWCDVMYVWLWVSYHRKLIYLDTMHNSSTTVVICLLLDSWVIWWIFQCIFLPRMFIFLCVWSRMRVFSSLFSAISSE